MELHIDSKEADLRVDSRSRFNLELLWDQLVGSNAVPVDGYELHLASWAVPYTWYGINSSNNVLVFEANSLKYAISIPVGTYNSADLASYLQTTMNSIAATESQVFTVTFDDTTGLFTFIKTSGSGTWGFLTVGAVSSTEAEPATAGTFTFSAYRALGFSAPIDGTTAVTALAANAEEVISTRVVNQVPIDRLFLEINWPDVRSYDSRTHGHNSAIAQLSPYGQWGDLLTWSAPSPTRFRCYKLPAQLEVALVDSDGTEVDLNGHDWYFTLVVYGLEGMTPMTNTGETKHDTRQQTSQRNIRATTYSKSQAHHAHDAPSRDWQGHANAAKTDYGNSVQLNPQRRSNPFRSAI
jgi:hypothetical protein